MNKKQNLEKKDKALHIAFVRQRIKPSDLLKTTDEIFSSEADEFAKYLADKFTSEQLNKFKYYAEYSLFPFCKYVSLNDL